MANIYINGVEEKYPKELIKNRSNIEGSVIGLICKDLLILDECQLTVHDFITQDGQLFFQILRNLRNKGYNEVDELTVVSNLSDENIMQRYQEANGYDELNRLTEIVNHNNAESILDNLHRENILIKLYNSGFNITREEEIVVNGESKHISILEKFRKMKSEDIVSYYEVELNKYAVGYNSKILEENKTLTVDKDFLNKLYDGEENGVPFGTTNEVNLDLEKENVYPYLSRDIKGLIRGSTTMMAAYSSVGKTTYWIGLIISLISQGEKILIFSNEQDSTPFKVDFLCWIAYKHFRYYNITKSKVISGELTDDLKQKLDEVTAYYNEKYGKYITFIHLPDMDLSTIKKKTRYYALKEGISVVLIDTLKMDYDSGVSDQMYHALIKETRDIDAMAKRYDLIMLCSFQLAPATLGKLFLDVTCLSGAKAVKDTLENLFLMRVCYKEEFNPDNKRIYCKPFQKTYVDGVYKEKDFIPDPSKIYRMVFVDKCRNGRMSSDSGTALLLEFDGQHSLFKEVAYCRPSRYSLT